MIYQSQLGRRRTIDVHPDVIVASTNAITTQPVSVHRSNHLAVVSGFFRKLSFFLLALFSTFQFACRSVTNAFGGRKRLLLPRRAGLSNLQANMTVHFSTEQFIITSLQVSSVSSISRQGIAAKGGPQIQIRALHTLVST